MVDILDRRDKSLAPVPNINGKFVGVPKRIKNDWSQGGKPGNFTLIDKHLIGIDGAYQRNATSLNRVLEIARKWDWLLFGVLYVIVRSDGTFWVFDGGHRLRASFYRDDIRLLPCMVYELDSISDEAKAFIGKNTMSQRVESNDKYKAAVLAGCEIAQKTDSLLKEFGVSVVKHPSSPREIACSKTLMKIVESDEVLARECFQLCMTVCRDEPVSSALLRGLFMLCKHFQGKVDIIKEYGDRIATLSQGEFMTMARQKKAVTGKGGERFEALAILDHINKGRRLKLRWEQ